MIEFVLVYMLGTTVINQDQTFRNVNDCLYFAKRLNDQPEIPYSNATTKKITVYCKPVRKRVQNKK
jgi:glutathione synthase/RimK-type ligase-like ATP-grasp enzyme